MRSVARAITCGVALVLVAVAVHAEEPAKTTSIPVQLESLLRRWEADASKVKALACDIEVWDENPVFNRRRHAAGNVFYAGPTQWRYHITHEAAGDKMIRADGIHVEFQGDALLEFRHADRLLVENRGIRLPADDRTHQGKSWFEALCDRVVETPVRVGVMLFGPETEKLLANYEIRETTTDAERQKGESWLELVPKKPARLDFERAELILKEQEFACLFPSKKKDSRFAPYAIRLSYPGGAKSTHVFRNYKIAVHARSQCYAEPIESKVPEGWEHRIVEAPAK